MNDESLDREIESLLASEPSPEFVARVRTRVKSEPAPRRWRASWMFAAAGAVASVIVAAMAWPSSEPTSPTVRDRAPAVARAGEVIAPPALPAVQDSREGVAVARQAVTKTAQPDGVVEIDLPEVVIADNEVRTFASLVANIRQSRFDTAVPVAPNPDTPLEIKELPPVEPLEIEPIVRVAALEAEGERP